MLDLSPTKLIIVFVVAIVLLGPKRLPQVARQVGAAWAKARSYSQRIDSELRHSMPDLPTSRDIMRYARSPITLLNELADSGHDDPDAPVEDPAAPCATAPGAPGAPGAAGAGSGARPWPEDRASATPARATAPRAPVHGVVSAPAQPQPAGEPGDLALLAVDDPTLN